jgi:hypothetical protein
MMMMSWDQMVHEQSFARIIDAFADALDLSGLGFLNCNLNQRG